jgi:acyl carrier protein
MSEDGGTITLAGVYSRIKRLLAEKKNVPRSEILADDDLVKDLGFTSAGVRALAIPISDEFSSFGVKVSRDEMSETDTVRSVARLVWDKIPPDRKA